MHIPKEVEHLAHWLEAGGVQVTELIQDAESRLAKKGREIFGKTADRYRRKVVLGVFLAEFAAKYRTESILQIAGTEDHQLFQFAVLEANDGAFKKHLRKFIRLQDDEWPLGRDVTSFTRDSFSDFVVEESAALTERFLTNFDASRSGAQYNALNYLQMLSMSQFVKKEVRASRSNPSGYLGHVEASKRLSERTRLAFKLAYVPLALRPEEVEILEKKYGWPRTATRQANRIKDVAAGLGFSSAAVLSRKLYRVREWADRAANREAA